VIKKFLKMTQNKFDAKVKKIRIDNDTEFKNIKVEDFLDEEGIKHEFLTPYTPQQNGVTERKNCTLIEMVRIMLDEYKTSNRFWTEVINTACQATNRLYLHKLLKKTSYKLITGNESNISYFRDFERVCYVLHKRSKSSKFSPKVYEGFLLAYDSNSRVYHVFNVTIDCVESTCDTVFDETNDSQKEQVDIDLVDNEEASCDTLQRMAIGDVGPQDPNDQPKELFSNDTIIPVQGLDPDNHEEEDEHHNQVKEENNDQGGDEDDGDKGETPQYSN
jgi:hypothetical protein